MCLITHFSIIQLFKNSNIDALRTFENPEKLKIFLMNSGIAILICSSKVEKTFCLSIVHMGNKYLPKKFAF